MKNLDTYFAYLASLFRRSGAVEDAVQYQSHRRRVEVGNLNGIFIDPGRVLCYSGDNFVH